MTDLYLECILLGGRSSGSFEDFVDLAWEFADDHGFFRVCWLDWVQDAQEDSTYRWFPSRAAIAAHGGNRFREEPKGKIGLIEENERSKVQLLYSPQGFTWKDGVETKEFHVEGSPTWLEWERYEQLDCSFLRAGGILFTVSGPAALAKTVLPYAQALRELFLDLVDRCNPVLGWCGEQGNTLSPATKTVRDRRIWFLNWVNVFGPPYVEKYGRDFFLEAPGFEKKVREDGSILYQVTEGFAPWEARNPSPEEVEAYFAAHPKVHKVTYRPWLKKALAKG